MRFLKLYSDLLLAAAAFLKERPNSKRPFTVRVAGQRSASRAQSLNSVRRSFLVVMLITAHASARMKGAPPTAKEPELPQILVDTTFPSTSGYRIMDVAAGGDLQAAINDASCNPNGTVLRLAAEAAYTGSFTLPAKNCAAGQWIIIRTNTADANLPPPDVRISPKYAPALAKIFSSNVAPAIKTASRAEHYWFMGLEIGVQNDVPMNYGVFVVGHKETSLADLPHHIVVDRCYVHGNSAGAIKRGMEANGAYLAAVNSYFENFHVIGQDTQAIAGWNGPGPFKIVNNFLEAAGENIMFGGALPTIPSVIPSDIEIRRNHLFKPLSWKPGDPGFAGVTWTVKNILEFKDAQRVLVEGNVLENNWAQAQVGFGVLFTPRGQQGQSPWCTVADVTFRYNILIHSGSGINIAGEDSTGPSQPSQRISIHDNLLLDINNVAWGGDGRLYQVLNGPRARAVSPPHDITISHNTGVQTGNMISTGDTRDNPITNFIFTNNIQAHGMWGIMGSGARAGSGVISTYFAESIFSHNVIVGPSFRVSPADYPPDNFFPSVWDDVQFVDFKNGDLRLKSSSRYHNAGSDGKNIGADIDAVRKATAGVAP